MTGTATNTTVIDFARHADLPMLLQSSARTSEEHAQRQPHHFAATDAKLDRCYHQSFRRWRIFRKTTATNILVARIDDSAVGYISLIIPRNLIGKPSGLRSAVVADVFVNQFRNQGIAGHLLRRAEQLAAELGISELTAVVWGGNTASHALFDHSNLSSAFTVYKNDGDAAKPRARSFSLLFPILIFLPFALLAFCSR